MNYENKQMIHNLIDEAMEKKDRYVSVFISDTGVSISVYPMDERGYDPVAKAYQALVKDEDVNAAIGYLGEALE